MTDTASRPSLLSIFEDGDTPRTRRSDPATSHAAADATQGHMRQTKVRVMRVVKDHGPIVGSEINDMYHLTGTRLEWSPVAHDTPRKRAGELVADGYLEVIGTRAALGNHLEESIYKLTEKGQRVIDQGLLT